MPCLLVAILTISILLSGCATISKKELGEVAGAVVLIGMMESMDLSSTAEMYYLEHKRWPEGMEDIQRFASDKDIEIDLKKYESAEFTELEDGSLQLNITMRVQEEKQKIRFQSMPRKYEIKLKRPKDEMYKELQKEREMMEGFSKSLKTYPKEIE